MGGCCLGMAQSNGVSVTSEWEVGEYRLKDGARA